jgi:hypothetical protein
MPARIIVLHTPEEGLACRADRSPLRVSVNLGKCIDRTSHATDCRRTQQAPLHQQVHHHLSFVMPRQVALCLFNGLRAKLAARSHSDSVWPLTIRARREQVSLPSPHFRHNGALPLHGNASAALRVRASFFKGRPCRHYRADDSRHGLPENRQPYGNYTISSGSCHVNGNMTSHFAQNSTREPPFFGG